MNQLIDLFGLFNCLRPEEPMSRYAFDEAQNTGTRDINLSKIDNIEFEDIDRNDYPDFCDAYVSSADMNGYPMTEEELNDLNENHRDFVYEKLLNHLF